jgi:FlaA1/EpsC-like NDP-sugar epimerase
MYRIVQKILYLVSKQSRRNKTIFITLYDFFLSFFSAYSAYILRLGWNYEISNNQIALIFSCACVNTLIFHYTGINKTAVRFMGEKASWQIVLAIAISTLLWSFIAFLTQLNGISGLPRSIPFIYFTIYSNMTLFSRFTIKKLLNKHLKIGKITKKRVLIYGAGTAGRQLASSIQKSNDFQLLGFVDDKKELQGISIMGCNVFSPDRIPILVNEYNLDSVILSMPSAPMLVQRRIVEKIEKYGPKAKILPSVSDIISGKHLINLVREIDIGDLLGRDETIIQYELQKQCIESRVILITGAGGSIGSELSFQISMLNPKSLIILDSSEYSLYKLERSLIDKVNCKLIPILGSVCDKDLINQVLRKYKVSTIFHAAAYKHVPLVEGNVRSSIINNIIGTYVISSSAFDVGVMNFILISTDKAVRPTNIMGASKRGAELIVQHFSRKSIKNRTKQIFSGVRFGNVLGSSGSVIPLFKEQISKGGPLTVTHPEVTRFFMSIHEAVQLVIYAGNIAAGGEIFLLEMGEAVKISDLACRIIELNGKSLKSEQNPDGDIEICYTGLRPGEKLYEELLISEQNSESTIHPKIMKALEPQLDETAFETFINEITQAIAKDDEQAMRTILSEYCDLNAAI